jgi:hypothetical protein
MGSVLFGALVAASTAIAGCRSANQPDPVTYALRFQPDSLSLPVGARGSLSMFATTTSGSDVDIRLVEWVVDDQTIATLDNSQLTIGSPISATINVTCLRAGQTKAGGNVTLNLQDRVSGRIGVTCTATPEPPS